MAQDELRRINALRGRLPYCSQSALSAMLRIARDEPEALPLATRRADIRAARDQETTGRMTPYGPLHQTVSMRKSNGREIEVEFQHPLAMLYTLCLASPWFSNMVERTHDADPSSPARPWSLVYYNDEITMGNQLKKKNRRKCEAIYWAVLQFGMSVLSDEEAWIELCVLQSTIRKALVGGIAALTVAMLLQFFGGGHNVLTAGITLTLFSGRSILVFFVLNS